jgi:hypothetical protein
MKPPPFLGHEIVYLAPGVFGFTRDDPDGSLVIPMVIAEHEGTGDVGRYLDSLPTNRRIVVEECISMRLAGMLERRGFKEQQAATFDPDTQEMVTGHVREAVHG